MRREAAHCKAGGPGRRADQALHSGVRGPGEIQSCSRVLIALEAWVKTGCKSRLNVVNAWQEYEERNRAYREKLKRKMRWKFSPRGGNSDTSREIMRLDR